MAPDSFEFAKETVTQLITLATAVIGVSVTFAKDINPAVTGHDRRWLLASWIALLLSVVFGVLTLMSLTGTLAGANVQPAAIYERNIAWPAAAQIISFLGGVLLLIVHAAR